MNKITLALIGSLAITAGCSDNKPSTTSSSNSATTTTTTTNSTAATPEVACGSVTIAEMNWNSAALIANVDQYILKHGYGCDASLVSGDTMPTGTSMVEKGEPDIAPELWSNGLREALDKGVAEKRLRYAGNSLSDGGEEGFWVPEYLVQKDPSLATIEGIKANVSMFKHPEDPEKSMFMGCPAGWNCQISASNLYRALELESAGFALVDPGSGAALSGAIAKAYERQTPWFGYYWAPTSVLGKYKMVKVDFGSGIDKAHYEACITQENCAEPKPTMYPPSAVQSVTTEAFAARVPQAYDYIAKRSFKNSEMNELLAWMEDNQADGQTGAEHFLRTQPEKWRAWVSAEIAEKIAQALGSNS